MCERKQNEVIALLSEKTLVVVFSDGFLFYLLARIGYKDSSIEI